MADARDRFLAAAAHLGVSIDAQRFPDGTRTAADAAAAIGCEIDQIVKSLVFVATDRDDAQRPVLALTSGGRRVDTLALANVVDAVRVRKADADEVRAATGFSIGGTPPFGHPSQIETWLDPNLARFDEVWAAAGTPHDVFRLTPQDLLRSGARFGDDFTTD